MADSRTNIHDAGLLNSTIVIGFPRPLVTPLYGILLTPSLPILARGFGVGFDIRRISLLPHELRELGVLIFFRAGQSCDKQ